MKGEDEMTNNDWRQMEAGPELDAIIARALGYTAERAKHNEYLVNVLDAERNRINQLESDDPLPDDLDEKTIMKCLRETVFEEQWSDDLNAAITLLDPRWEVMIARYDQHWDCSINNISSRLRDHGNGEAQTPAHAVCRAWLAWTEKNPIGRTIESEDA